MTREQIIARLEKVNAAIDAALTGKRYRISSGGTERELERQPLSDLLKLQQSLNVQLARMNVGSACYGVPAV